MDFKLAALKLFASQLAGAVQSPSNKFVMTLFGLRFQRAWLQGVIVSVLDADADSGSGERRMLLDDGTAVVELWIPVTNAPGQQIDTGMYLMVVGALVTNMESKTGLLIKVHKIVDLSPFPDRESMWYLEVIEANKMFYTNQMFSSESLP